ncbi:vitamin K-dependent protein Z [Echinops telfairi]|uniref:Vitamin K-dependent protein Z n=1 Tax=Echinops telfairi TaxID=9371 RepID=A0AC55CJD6_ECHTE|nr:vitamin K-dependent protein Z [Echinops telfairi]
MAGGFLGLRGLFLVLLLHQTEQSVFLTASKANEVLVRWKRAGSYLLEEIFQGNLEKECYEEICVYEEAREVFENNIATETFWEGYMGGTQCLSQPCLNNGSCQDNIRSYTCYCSSGYEGRNCAYEKCACGILSSEYIMRLKNENNQILPIFPWQVKLTDFKGNAFCGGVILQENFVLTTATCSLMHSNMSVTTNFNRKSNSSLTTKVKRIHVHMRYNEETGENNVSLLELEEPIQCLSSGLPVCLPENDFAEHILLPKNVGLVSGWTLTGNESRASLMKVLVSQFNGEDCGRALNVTVTTRMYCEKSPFITGQWMEGSIVTRPYKGTWFLTGIMHTSSTKEYGQVFLFTKISRYSLWFRQIMN